MCVYPEFHIESNKNADIQPHRNGKRRLTIPGDYDSLSESLGPSLGEDVGTKIVRLCLEFRIQLILRYILNIG